MKKIAAILLAALSFFSAAPAESATHHAAHHAARPAAPAGSNPAKIISLGFDLFDTSLDGELLGPRADEARRLKRISDQLERFLKASPLFTVVDAAPVWESAAEQRPIHKCNGCEVLLARQAGADYAVFGVVQKVSNLILSIVIVFRDARDGKIVLTAAADIRGNDDKAWTNGVRWLLKHRVDPGER